MQVTVYVRGRATKIHLDALQSCKFRELLDTYKQAGRDNLRLMCKSRDLPYKGNVAELAERMAGWRILQPAPELSVRQQVDEHVQNASDAKLAQALQYLNGMDAETDAADSAVLSDGSRVLRFSQNGISLKDSTGAVMYCAIGHSDLLRQAAAVEQDRVHWVMALMVLMEWVNG